MNHRHIRSILFTLLSLDAPLGYGEARTDGTMGAVRNLSGHFEVPQALGTLKGQNLFHSFQTFQIRNGESATFTGEHSIKNVISRVTGDEATKINGPLRSKVGQADFYFINPRGVTFGKNAQIDMPAAFKVSTASEIRFPEGAYSAIDPKASTLSVEKPEAFGFLGNQSGKIALELSHLQAAPKREMALIGRELQVSQSQLTAEQGRLRLEAVGTGQADVPVNTASTTAAGKVTIQGSTLDVSGRSAGTLTVRGGAVSIQAQPVAESALQKSRLSADQTGASDAPAGRGLQLQAEHLTITDSSLSASASGEGRGGTLELAARREGHITRSTLESSGNGAGRIALRGGNLTVSGSNLLAHNTGARDASSQRGIDIQADRLTVQNEGDAFSKIRANLTGSGQGGHVTVSVAGELQVQNSDLGANVGDLDETAPASTGAAGAVQVSAQTVTLDGGGINSKVSYAQDRGPAGPVKVQVTDELTLRNGAWISSDTLGIGQAGAVNVSAHDIALDSESAITSDAVANLTGNAGSVTLKVINDLKMQNEAWISSSTWGIGQAGAVNVLATRIFLDSESAIRSNAVAGSTGNAGSVTLKATDHLNLQNGSILASDTGGTGHAGLISVTANRIELDSDSWIRSQAHKDSSGNAGAVTLTALETFSVKGNSVISTGSAGQGSAGDIVLMAKTLNLDQAMILGQANEQSNGRGGNLTIGVSGLFLAKDSVFSSTAAGSGAAGLLEVNAEEVKLDNSGVISSAYGGQGGRIDLAVNGDIAITGHTILGTSTYREGNSGDLQIKAKSLKLDQDSALITQTAPGSTGHAGAIGIAVEGPILMTEGSKISSVALGTGQAGDIAVTAESLSLVGNSSQIISAAYGGHGGAINVTTQDALKMSDHSTINAGTYGQEDGGNIQIRSTSLSLANDSAIISQASKQALGNAGRIDIEVSGSLSLSDASSFSSTALGTSNAGNLKIQAGTLQADSGEGVSHFTVFGTEAYGGQGGSIDVTVQGDLEMTGSSFRSSTHGSGNGGPIRIAAQSLKLDQQSDINSITTPESAGHGGDISLRVDDLLSLAGSSALTTSAQGTGNSGNLNIDVGNGRFSTHSSYVFSSALGTGNAGELKVKAGTLIMDGAGLSSFARDGHGGMLDVTVTGAMEMTQTSSLSSTTDGQGHGGDIRLQAGSLRMNHSAIASNSKKESSGHAGQITLAVDDLFSIESSSLQSAALGTGDAGRLRVSAGSLNMSGSNSVAGFSSEAHGGRGGDLEVTVTDALSLKENSFITATTYGQGKGGDIQIHAKSVSLDQNAGIVSETSPQTTGNAGSIHLQTEKNLTLTQGSSISTRTQGLGQAGDIQIQSEQTVRIGGVNDAQSITLPDGRVGQGQFSRINLETFGSGNGGNLRLEADRLIIGDGGEISAVSAFGGTPETQGGSLDLHAKAIQLQGGGLISTSTSGAGTAGSIHLTADESLSIAGRFDRSQHTSVTTPRISDQSGLISNATRALDPNARELGPGGAITVKTPQLFLNDGGLISVSTEGDHPAGQLDLHAPILSLTDARITSAAQEGSRGDAGTITVHTEHLQLQRSAISTEAWDGQGGDIAIDGARWLRLQDSEIQTSVLGQTNGNGGDIDLTGKILLLETGLIQANTAAPKAHGGDIRIAVEALVPSGAMLQVGGNQVQPIQHGRFGYNVIQAAAPDGVSGAIDLGPPQLDLSGVLANLSSPPFDLSELTRDYCALSQGSSLTRAGRGGTPPKAEKDPWVMP